MLISLVGPGVHETAGMAIACAISTDAFTSTSLTMMGRVCLCYRRPICARLRDERLVGGMQQSEWAGWGGGWGVLALVIRSRYVSIASN
jgi:hypothetical protein